MYCASSWRSTTIWVAIPAWSVPGLPQGVVPRHAVIAGEGVHQGVLESVAHVQRAGDVGRRQHDAVGGSVGGIPARGLRSTTGSCALQGRSPCGVVCARLEIAGTLPLGIQRFSISAGSKDLASSMACAQSRHYPKNNAARAHIPNDDGLAVRGAAAQFLVSPDGGRDLSFSATRVADDLANVHIELRQQRGDGFHRGSCAVRKATCFSMICDSLGVSSLNSCSAMVSVIAAGGASGWTRVVGAGWSSLADC
jgi:hypothetical protein